MFFYVYEMSFLVNLRITYARRFHKIIKLIIQKRQSKSSKFPRKGQQFLNEENLREKQTNAKKKLALI